MANDSEEGADIQGRLKEEQPIPILRFKKVHDHSHS